MVAYSFKPRFVLPIELGEKRQTIRGVGKKRHARSGDTLQLYTGPRMKPRKIGEATCESSSPITLAFGDATKRPFVVFGDPQTAGPGEILITPAELDEFAVLDGFADWQALADFWAETHAPLPAEWTGIIVRWGETFRGGLALNPPAGAST
mgnify:CR=1 FL=1